MSLCIAWMPVRTSDRQTQGMSLHLLACASKQVPLQIQKYLSKISGPLLDRIDIHLEVPALGPIELTSAGQPAESSALIRERTVKAREVQLRRFQDHSSATTAQSSPAGNKATDAGRIFANAQMNQKQIKEFCVLTNESQELLHKAVEELGFSARAYDKILKVSRTIADLEASADILPSHIAEAIQYRCLDRREWF